MTWLRLRRARREMDRLAGELLRSLYASPEDCDSREPLWMRRETLRGGLHSLTA